MRRFSLFIFFLLLSQAAWAGQTWQLTILHTNDLHGMMLPFAYNGDERGGLARRAMMIKGIRAQVAHSLALIDCGDVFTRGPWHTKFYGVPEIESLNAMGYDMLCIGNNEFKATAETDSQGMLLALMRRSRFPWLAANLTVGTTGVPAEGVHPYIIRDFGGVRVGFLGLTAPRAKDYAQTKGWTIADPIEAAKQWVPIARKECDILIAVTHIGVDLNAGPSLDRDLAARVPGIDAIVGGDSHTFLTKPQLIDGPNGRKVPIFQAGEQGVALGRADLTFEKTDDNWRLTAVDGKLLPIDKTVPDDPVIKLLLDRWLAPKPIGLLPQRMPEPVWAA